MGDQCEKNLMPVYNLAPLWGPNMMTVDGAQETPGGHGANFGQTSGQMEVFQAVGNISTVVCTNNTNICLLSVSFQCGICVKVVWSLD